MLILAEKKISYMNTKLGSLIDEKKVVKGVPPVVLQLQVTGYIPLEKPEELKQWEADLKLYHGVDLKSSNAYACETCSACCSDDCGFHKKF
jgi:hypothetical protein